MTGLSGQKSIPISRRVADPFSVIGITMRIIHGPYILRVWLTGVSAAWGMSLRYPRKGPEWWSVLKRRVASTFDTTSYANAVVQANSERSMATVRRRMVMFDVRGFCVLQAKIADRGGGCLGRCQGYGLLRRTREGLGGAPRGRSEEGRHQSRRVSRNTRVARQAVPTVRLRDSGLHADIAGPVDEQNVSQSDTRRFLKVNQTTGTNAREGARPCEGLEYEPGHCRQHVCVPVAVRSCVEPHRHLPLAVCPPFFSNALFCHLVPSSSFYRITFSFLSVFRSPFVRVRIYSTGGFVDLVLYSLRNTRPCRRTGETTY